MTRPSFDWRASVVSSGAASARYIGREYLSEETSKQSSKENQVTAGKHIDCAVSPREQRCAR
eukprot:COSAG02_NODE_305_length_25176_cov_30.787455_18_plen_62_part_00